MAASWYSLLIKPVIGFVNRLTGNLFTRYRERVRVKTEWRMPKGTAPLFFPVKVLYVKFYKPFGPPVRIDRIYLEVKKLRFEPDPKTKARNPFGNEPDLLEAPPWPVEPGKPLEVAIGHLWQLSASLQKQGLQKDKIAVRVVARDRDERTFRSGKVAFHPREFYEWADARFDIEEGSGVLSKWIREWWKDE
mgnify:CR=1 FL=1